MNIQEITNLLQEFEGSNFEKDILPKLSFLLNGSRSERTLYDALEGCIIHGKQMNEYLFTLPVENNLPVVWMGKTNQKFVWMTGYIDPVTSKVRALINQAKPRLYKDPLTTFQGLPPYLLYLNVFAQSQWQNSSNVNVEEKVSDFSIFQVEVEEDEIQDIDQKMVMNSDFLVNQALTYTQGNVRQYMCKNTYNAYVNGVIPNLSLLTKLHTELHNIGHFMGVFPYKKPQKDNSNYEAIEEYKACLTAIYACYTLDISTVLKEAFALLVVCTRIFNYAYRAHYAENKTQQIIREITVGVLFHELLRKYEVITGSNPITIDIPKILPAVKQELQVIYNQEKLSLEDNSLLDQYACYHYQQAYPNAKLSEEMSRIYA